MSKGTTRCLDSSGAKSLFTNSRIAASPRVGFWDVANTLPVLITARGFAGREGTMGAISNMSGGAIGEEVEDYRPSFEYLWTNWSCKRWLTGGRR